MNNNNIDGKLESLLKNRLWESVKKQTNDRVRVRIINRETRIVTRQIREDVYYSVFDQLIVTFSINKRV